MATANTSIVTIPPANNNQFLLRTISDVVRKNEKRILRGECKLSLDTLSLACLNHFFAVHYEGLGTSSASKNGLDKKHVKDVEFLFEVVQKTPIMKLVHGTSTLQGTVDISKFNALTELDIKKVPVHLLSGLKSLRHQLKVLSCTRCINTLQEVFGNQRGKDNIPELWPHLHTLDLSFNQIETLSELMECFPNLRSLDLSHNNLISVEDYLKWLPKLMYLNIGYNRLKNIPNLGVQGKRCLISLAVRNNNLDNLDGIEELDGLEELEASHNCIHDEKWLEVFSQLHYLAMVNLQGNPVSYNTNFRENIIKNMSPKATIRCPIIDDKPISKQEKTLERKKVSKRPLQKYRQSANFMESSFESSIDPSMLDNFPSINDSSRGPAKETESQLKKARKVRTPTISNTFQDPSKIKEKGPRQRAATTNSDFRSEMDKMRQLHGPHWLIAVQNIKTDESSTDDGSSTKKAANGKKDRKNKKKKEVAIIDKPTVHVEDNRICLSSTEEEELCGPLLVRVEDPISADLQHVFLTVRGTFIQEKNLDGELIDQLDLRALKSITQGNETVLEDSGKHLIIPAIHLTFDYMRKDRQRRDYLMDDDKDSKLLLETLSPMLEQNQSSVIMKDRMQCLKCSKEFNKTDAYKEVQNRRNDQSFLTNDIESVREILVCPKCRSDLLVELDTMQWEDQQLPASTGNTPFGSLTSLNNALPLAASSPWKQTETKDQPYVRSLGSSPTDFHTPDNSPDSSPVSSFITTNHSSSSTITQTRISNSTAILDGDRTDGGSHNDTDVLEKDCATLERELKEDMSRLASPLPKQELPEYPHEKIEALLEVNKKEKFDQHYCLVPQDILGSNNSSRKSSRTSLVIDPSNRENLVLPTGARQMPVNHLERPRHNGHYKQSLFGRDSIDSDIMVLNHNGNVADVDNDSPLETSSNSQSGLVKALNSGPEIRVGNGNMNDFEASTSSGNTPYGSLLDSFITDKQFTSDSESESSKIVRPSGLTVSNRTSRGLANSNRSLEATPFGTPHNSSPVSGEIGGLSDYISATDSQINNGYSNDLDDPSDYFSTATKEEQEKEESAIAVDDLDHSFTTVDHRLKLYFSMSLFGDVEEFACMLKGQVFQHNKLIEFPGLMVVSTTTIFIMKITNKESDNPSDWVFKKSQHPIKDLRHLHVGVGSQCIQLEFNTEVSVYTIQIKDKLRCEQFIHCLLDVVENCADAKRFAGVSRNHALTLFNVLETIHKSDANESIDEDSTLRTYIIGSLKSYKTIRKVCQAVDTTCSIVVTSNEICILDENYFWPLNPNNSIPPKMKQFTVKQLELISNISGIVLFKDSEQDISVGFFNEGSGEESYWHLQTETKSSLRALISALEEPWEKMFGVELQCTVHPSILVQEDM
ncbi:serine/threonine-protein kinase 11-interacting protein-like isoform X2 [Anneissia japonica]|uniref:serine/threonine-protein kinase 11-interacting protein-like isoform X2 n=1 Tax=Anneissia japonica TaxID=1529436 RepID=UPI0014258318|nr:serine/threonine-protein kinase 11-interacting protein-like isoform X2 [Anneissia japonica]